MTCVLRLQNRFRDFLAYKLAFDKDFWYNEHAFFSQ